MKQIDDKIGERKAESKKNTETVPYSKILMTQAETLDKYLMTFGYAFAIMTGLALPSFVFIMGDIVNSFGDNAVEAINR